MRLLIYDNADDDMLIDDKFDDVMLTSRKSLCEAKLAPSTIVDHSTTADHSTTVDHFPVALAFALLCFLLCCAIWSKAVAAVASFVPLLRRGLPFQYHLLPPPELSPCSRCMALSHLTCPLQRRLLASAEDNDLKEHANK